MKLVIFCCYISFLLLNNATEKQFLNEDILLQKNKTSTNFDIEFYQQKKINLIRFCCLFSIRFCCGGLCEYTTELSSVLWSLLEMNAAECYYYNGKHNCEENNVFYFFSILNSIHQRLVH